MRSSPSLVAVSALLVALAVAPPAAADSQAEQLFKEGIALRDKGDLAGACSKFEESYRLSKETGPLLNWANCDEKRGRLVSAFDHWKKASVELPDGEGKKLAQKRVAELGPRVPHVTVKTSGAPAGTHAELDGNPIAANEAVAVDPGDHVIVVSAPGYEPERLSVSVRESENRDVPLLPTRPSAGGAPTPTPRETAPAPPATAPPPADAPSSSRKTVGFVVGAIGLAGAAAFGVTGGLVLSKKSTVDTCNQTPATANSADCASARSAGRTLNIVNAVAFGVGLAGLGAGIVLIATAPSAPKTGAASTLHVAISPSGVSTALTF